MHIFLFILCVCGHECMEVRGQYWKHWFCLPIMQAQGIELRLSGLAASVFTYWAILSPQLKSFKIRFIYVFAVACAPHIA